MNNDINIMAYYYILYTCGNIIYIFSNICCITSREAQQLVSKLSYMLTLIIFKFMLSEYELSKNETNLIRFIQNNEMNDINKNWGYKSISSNLIGKNIYSFKQTVATGNVFNKIINTVSLKLICIKYIYEHKELFGTKIKLLPIELKNIFEMKLITNIKNE